MTGTRVVPGAHRVVVVGAGLAGLAAALHLRGAGKEVTVLERADTVGGCVGTYTGPGYEIDNGATVLTMPELIADALAAVGADAGSVDPPLRTSRLSPAYHARFDDGSTLDVHSDPDAMTAEITRVCGAEEAKRYLRLRAWLADIFDAEYDRFMDANFDSPLDLVSSPAAVRDLLRLLRIGGFGRLGTQVGRRVTDPRLRRVFTFQALYAGVAPAQALAVYGAIAHMDTTLGVYTVEGGMRQIARTMAAAFVGAGGRLHLGSEVTALDVDTGRVTAVSTAAGDRYACDAVVLTPGSPVVDSLLPARRRRRTLAAPSAVVLHGTVPTAVSGAWSARHHHVIDFGGAWERTFAEITRRRGRGRLMSDPSLLITRPALSDPGQLLERDGREHEPLSVLAPCPNLDSAPFDWSALSGPYRRELLAVLESRGYRGVANEFRVDHVDTPATWHARGMIAGSPFAAAHVFRQTGPFRRRNVDPRFPNVVLAGSDTVPGVGVPTVLMSGRLAAERLGVPRTRRTREPGTSRLH
ncbi:phytoene desaturase family protein [Rhodococcus sp. (in: high G+C Gram-positive bacteria)]|uniref:phytoene desaturase family protein n=2 Tax=Rhodococcus sp. TaxID=1831 RepID=UPI0019E4CF57|nr:phytoene desaturase family protein [Rhodococcus sp. (in: high G+C Gram-positive bacteria)]MBF0660049.1 phytoene desaturase [Rhodococcus sp. (in: high G+C Gram-positive bacteria)]